MLLFIIRNTRVVINKFILYLLVIYYPEYLFQILRDVRSVFFVELTTDFDHDHEHEHEYFRGHQRGHLRLYLDHVFVGGQVVSGQHWSLYQQMSIVVSGQRSVLA